MGILFTVKLFYEKEYVIAFAYAVEKKFWFDMKSRVRTSFYGNILLLCSVSISENFFRVYPCDTFSTLLLALRLVRFG